MNPPSQKTDLIACAVLCFLVLELTLYFCADRPVALFMRDHDGAVTDFFRAITDLGKSVWYLVPCGLAALFCAFLSRGKDVKPAMRRLFGYVGVRALFLFLTIAVSGVVADIIKPIAGRARPLLFLRDNMYGFAPFTKLGFQWNSMPSGHTTTAFALACSLSLFYPKLRPVWFAYALLLAASRVFVDAHYLSDVCAGAALGTATVYIARKYMINPLSRVIFPIDR